MGLQANPSSKRSIEGLESSASSTSRSAKQQCTIRVGSEAPDHLTASTESTLSAAWYNSAATTATTTTTGAVTGGGGGGGGGGGATAATGAAGYQSSASSCNSLPTSSSPPPAAPPPPPGPPAYVTGAYYAGTDVVPASPSEFTAGKGSSHPQFFHSIQCHSIPPVMGGIGTHRQRCN